MSVKVIAVDMDGTFLTSDNQYNKEKFMKQYEYMKKMIFILLLQVGINITSFVLSFQKFKKKSLLLLKMVGILSIKIKIYLWLN